MREVLVNGVKFEVRGLRLSEVSARNMRKLGYGRFVFKPELNGNGDTEKLLGDIMDAALYPVLGQEGYEEVDAAGGLRGLQQVWRAILNETYGTPGEEKNSLSAGNGKPTPSGSPTATPAENTGAESA
jgi:hypothetical protein